MTKLKDTQSEVWKSKEASSEKYWNLPHDRGIKLVEYLKTRDVNSVFEVGCSSGRNLWYIKNSLSDLKIGGLEINKKACEEAKRQIPDANLYNMNLHDMDVSDKYDVVYTGGVLMHIAISDVVDVISKCIAKANKYVIHMEPVGEDITTDGPEETNPTNRVRKTLRCLHNIERIYCDLGYKSKIDTIQNMGSEIFISVKVA